MQQSALTSIDLLICSNLKIAVIIFEKEMASGLLDPYFASTIHDLSALKLEESMWAISTDGAYSTTCISIGVNKSNKLHIHMNTDK